MQTSHLKKWLSKTAGIDRAVAYAASGRIWQIVVGVVNIILIARFITRSEQGYLYTFQSLLTFQLLRFEPVRCFSEHRSASGRPGGRKG